MTDQESRTSDVSDVSNASEATLDQASADLLVFSVWELRQAANRAFEPLELTTFHVAMLNLIAQDPLLRSGDLTQRLGALHVRTSTILTQLEKRGLLARTTPPGDRRSRIVSLTEEGEALRLEANRLWREVTVNRYTGISRDQKEALLEVLQAIHGEPDETNEEGIVSVQ